MIYRNGRKAANGDKVVHFSAEGDAINVGVVYGAGPGEGRYNGSIASTSESVVDPVMCDCIHVDDLKALLAEHGLDKRP